MGYQLKMWNIVLEEVEAYQSDVLYDVQFIARHGEDKAYVWAVRKTGTEIELLPMTEKKYELFRGKMEIFGASKFYLILPYKNEVRSFDWLKTFMFGREGDEKRVL